MAAKNYLKNADFQSNDETLIGIVTEMAPYKICYTISNLLNISLETSIGANENRSPKNSSINNSNNIVTENSYNQVVLEVFKWKSESKARSVFLHPNKQEIEVTSKQNTSFGSIYDSLENQPTKTFTLIPDWKHIDYILRFEGFDKTEIEEIASKLKNSKLFRYIAVDETSKLKNTLILYLFD